MDNDVNNNDQNRTKDFYVLEGFVFGQKEANSPEEVRIPGVSISVRGTGKSARVSDSTGSFSFGLLPPGDYSLIISDPSGRYYSLPQRIHLDSDDPHPIELRILQAGAGGRGEGEGYGKSKKNVIHGFALSREKKPLSGITVLVKSVLLERKKQNLLRRTFSRAWSGFTFVVNRGREKSKNERTDQFIRIELKTNIIGRFSTKKLPNGSYIVSAQDPNGKYKFSSKFLVLKNKPTNPLIFTGFAQEDIEELKKKFQELKENKTEEKTEDKAGEKTEEKRRSNISLLRLWKLLKQKKEEPTRAVERPDTSGVTTSKGEFVKFEKSELLKEEKSGLSRASREALGQPRTLFRAPARYASTLGQRGGQLAGRSAQAATNAGIRAGSTAARVGMQAGLAAGRAAVAAGAAVAGTPVGWVIAAIAIAIVLIIVIIFFFSGSGGGSSFLSVGSNLLGGGSGGNKSGQSVCSTGSLDYSVPFRDSSILPSDRVSVEQQILARWPQAQLQHWDTIVAESQANGWNPAFVLTLWIEETGASHHTKTENGGGGIPVGYKADGTPIFALGHLGCAPLEDQTIDQSLSCLFNSFKSYTNFEDLMCVYGGDTFTKAPCTFVKENPNFPPNLKDWYSKLVPEGPGAISSASTCLVSGGGWPTTGDITQGPLGSFDHARLNRDLGEEALDIASFSGPPVFTTFDGETIVHDCILDGDCSGGWGGYGNSVEVVSNNGTFRVIFGHLSSFTVTNGQQVKAGDQLGFMGTTGHSTGIHLHWGFRGIKMATPNIPQDITPLACGYPDPDCKPSSISTGPGT